MPNHKYIVDEFFTAFRSYSNMGKENLLTEPPFFPHFASNDRSSWWQKLVLLKAFLYNFCKFLLRAWISGEVSNTLLGLETFCL